MKRYALFIIFSIALVFFLRVFVRPAAAAASYSPQQLVKLAEPIALFPDPLLQQILPAATFPDQIADAALLIRSKSDANLIQEQDWDNSVKVIASYLGILKMMYQNLDWTTDLGKAFLDQHEDLLDTIQDLRAKAKEHGNLKDSEQQTVSSKDVNGNTYITIQPSNPEVIYVPQQTTSATYSQSVTASDVMVPMATFGLGLALGAAFDDDDDHYYYSGGPWGGPMWGGNPSFDHWTDMRHDRNEDRHDEIMDRQDFRQNQRSDRQDFRQDWAKDHPDQINRDNLDKARTTYEGNKGQRQQKLTEARSSFETRQKQWSGQKGQAAQSRQDSWSSQNRPSSEWSTNGGGAYANRASSRGSFSRSGGSFSGKNGGFSGASRVGSGGRGRR